MKGNHQLLNDYIKIIQTEGEGSDADLNFISEHSTNANLMKLIVRAKRARKDKDKYDWGKMK